MKTKKHASSEKRAPSKRYHMAVDETIFQQPALPEGQKCVHGCKLDNLHGACYWRGQWYCIPHLARGNESLTS